jgi:hypothetical protein
MEYSALNEVAMRFGIALIGFKGISNGEKPLTGELVQWTEFASCHRQESRSSDRKFEDTDCTGRDQ